MQSSPLSVLGSASSPSVQPPCSKRSHAGASAMTYPNEPARRCHCLVAPSERLFGISGIEPSPLPLTRGQPLSEQEQIKTVASPRFEPTVLVLAGYLDCKNTTLLLPA